MALYLQPREDQSGIEFLICKYTTHFCCHVATQTKHNSLRTYFMGRIDAKSIGYYRNASYENDRIDVDDDDHLVMWVISAGLLYNHTHASKLKEVWTSLVHSEHDGLYSDQKIMKDQGCL